MVLSSPDDNQRSLYSRLCPSSWEWYMTYSVWDWNLQPTIYTTLGLLCKKIPSSPVWIVICFCLHLWLCNGPLNCPQSTPPSPKDCWDWLKPSHDSEKDGAPIIWMNDWTNSVLATVWKCFKETHSTINALQTSVRGLSKSKNVKVLKHFSACMRKTPFKCYWAKSDFFIFNVVTGHYFIHLCLLFCFIQVWRLNSTLCLPPPRLSQLPVLPSLWRTTHSFWSLLFNAFCFACLISLSRDRPHPRVLEPGGCHGGWEFHSRGCSVHSSHRLPWGLPLSAAAGCHPVQIQKGEEKKGEGG